MYLDASGSDFRRRKMMNSADLSLPEEASPREVASCVLQRPSVSPERKSDVSRFARLTRQPLNRDGEAIPVYPESCRKRARGRGVF